MSLAHVGPRLRRRLVPPALRKVFRGAMPLGLARALRLPPGVPFEKSKPSWVEVNDRWTDRRLLDELTALAGPALLARTMDLAAPAFPNGVLPGISFANLPLLARTRNCMEREKLLTPEILGRHSIGDLLAIPGFGIRCLVDLLTAVEAARRTVDKPAAPMQAALPSPRLTRAARLLANEPWAKDVRLTDTRLSARLLVDQETFEAFLQALKTGAFPLDEPLCPTPPRWNLDLLRCPLVTRTKNRLRDAGLNTLQDMGSLTSREVLALKGFGTRGLADLLTVFETCRFFALEVDAADRESTIADFCAKTIQRTSDPRFPERLAKRIHRVRTLGKRCLSLPLEVELRDLAASVSPYSPEMALAYLGWDGYGPRTLADVGKAWGMTGERVRQIVVNLTGRLHEISAWTPILRRALDACDHACPRPAGEIAVLLRRQGLARASFPPRSLLAAADALGLTHSLTVRRFGNTTWLFHNEQEALLRKCSALAKSAVASRGACSLGDLRAEVAEHTRDGLEENTHLEWIDRLPGFCWLDGDRQWFRFAYGGSSLEAALWKILAVDPELPIGELRDGLVRHLGPSSVPPPSMLRRLLAHLGLEMEGDTVRVRRRIHPKKVLTKFEFAFFDILRKEGPLLTSIDLIRRFRRRGMYRSTFWSCLRRSPILVRHASGFVGLRGIRAEPACQSVITADNSSANQTMTSRG
jgi:hypothetical protein